MSSGSLDEDLKILEAKLNQLKLDYERYFLGTRPREPVQLRGEVQKAVVVFTNTPLQNTALRFRFSSICSRFQAFKRRWDETLRQMEQGSYVRHRFKAKIHEGGAPTPGGSSGSGDDLYDSYRDARAACGQDVKALSRQKLDGILERQRKTLRERYGADAKFRFRVVVEQGKAKLKASRVKN